METGVLPAVGSRVEVFWEAEGSYFPGTVTSYTKQHKKHTIKYDDGEVEKVNLNKRKWRMERTATSTSTRPRREGTTATTAKSATPIAPPAEANLDVGATRSNTAVSASSSSVAVSHPSASTQSEEQQSPPVGSLIDVYWESKGKFITGKVTEFDAPRNRHKIAYVDGEIERLVLSKERWKLSAQQAPVGTTRKRGTVPSVGDSIEVLWPDDGKFYSGTVKRFDRRTGKFKVLYDDGEEEELKLAEEEWRPTIPENVGNSVPESTDGTSYAEEDANDGKTLPKVGDKIGVYWPDDDVHYPGTVASFNKEGKARVEYDDGDVETLRLEEEKWYYLQPKSKKRKLATENGGGK